jgi:hypothetical protein
LEHKLLTQADVYSILKKKPEENNYIDLLMHIYDYEIIIHEGIKVYYKDCLFKSVLKIIRNFKKFMSKQALFLSKEKIKKAMGINQEEFEFYLNFIPEIEMKNKLYGFSLKNLYSHTLCIHRILYETGHPMHIKELLEEIIKSGREVSEPGIYACLQSKKQERGVIPVGHTGQWTLREWGIETATMPDSLEQIFLKVKKPLMAKQLVTFLNGSLKFKTASIQSIKATLGIYKDKFIQYYDRSYGLREWNLSLPEKFLRKVIYFHKLKRDEILEKILKMLKKKKKWLLCNIVEKLVKQGYKRVVIYSTISRSSHLFVKERVNGSVKRYLSRKKSASL